MQVQPPNSPTVLKVAIDLDGTISEYPLFFSVMTRALKNAGCHIYIVTDRQPFTEEYIAQELVKYDITWDEIKVTGEKAKLILKEGITVLFDDTDRYFSVLPPSVAVFKVRQKYNWDFETQKWLDQLGM